jgi:uncharacterized coiled-coil protein SlyX
VSEERIEALAEQITNIRIDHAKMTQSVEHLSKTVDELAKAVTELTSYMNRGRGALWVFGVMSATAGGLISWATTLLFRH